MNGINSIRITFEALSGVNETPLSCRSEQCGGHTRCLVYMDMDYVYAVAGFDLRIL